MKTKININTNEVFDAFATLIIGVDIKSLPKSQQEEATYDVKEYLQEYLTSYVEEKYGKNEANRLHLGLSSYPIVFHKFPILKTYLDEALTECVNFLAYETV